MDEKRPTINELCTFVTTPEWKTLGLKLGLTEDLLQDFEDSKQMFAYLLQSDLPSHHQVLTRKSIIDALNTGIPEERRLADVYLGFLLKIRSKIPSTKCNDVINKLRECNFDFSEHWTDVARELNVPREYRNPQYAGRPVDAMENSIDYWLRNETATWEWLMVALEKCNEKKTAKELCERLTGYGVTFTEGPEDDKVLEKVERRRSLKLEKELKELRQKSDEQLQEKDVVILQKDDELRLKENAVLEQTEKLKVKYEKLLEERDQEVEEKVQELSRKVEELLRKDDDRDVVLAKVNKELKQKNKEIDEKDSLLRQKDKELIQKEEEKVQIQSSKNMELEKKEEMIQFINEKLVKKDEELNQQDEELNQQDEELNQKDQELHQKIQELHQKDEVLNQKDQELHLIQDKLCQLNQELDEGQKPLMYLAKLRLQNAITSFIKEMNETESIKDVLLQVFIAVITFIIFKIFGLIGGLVSFFGWIYIVHLQIKRSRPLFVLFMVIVISMISTDVLISTPHESSKQTFPTSVTYQVIGGQPQIINWPQGGFKMDIFHDSFPNEIPVNITVSVMDYWFAPPLRDFRSATQVYKIKSTREPSGNVSIHLKHNLIVSSDTDKSQLFLFHYKHLNSKPNMIPIDAISADTISTKIDNFSYYEVGVNQSKGIPGVYDVTFFYRETSGYDIIEVIAVILKHGPLGQELSDKKYSKMTEEPKSPFKMKHNGTSSMILEPTGCWAKYEDRKYNKTINDYDIANNPEIPFILQWNCWWWPRKTMISVQINDENFDIFVNPNIAHPVVYYLDRTFSSLPIVIILLIPSCYFAFKYGYKKLFAFFLANFFLFGWCLLERIWGINAFIATWWDKIATLV